MFEQEQEYPTSTQIIEITIQEKMFNPNIVFTFYSLSKNTFPGKGTNEKIPLELVEEYKESLSEFPDFRKMLSNFAESPFILDNLHWYSVEHYYQASKYKINNPDFYNSFSIDLGGELSTNPIMAKAYGGKSGKYKCKKIRNTNIIIDPDFFTKGRGKREMYKAQLSKFTQNEYMKRMLLATKDDLLLHSITRTSILQTVYNLMYIRNLLK